MTLPMPSKSKLFLLCLLGGAAWPCAAHAGTQLVSYWDPSLGQEHVYVESQRSGASPTLPGQLWEFLCGNGTCWGLTAIASGVVIPNNSPVMGYYSAGDQNNHVFYMKLDPTSRSAIVELYWPTGRYNGYNTRNLTTESGAQGPYMQIYTNGTFDTASELTGFVDSSGTRHVFYFDGASNVVENYFSGHWWANSPGGRGNYGQSTGISSLWDGSVEHVYFAGYDGNLWEDYDNGQWWSHPLTGSTGAVQPTISASQAPSGYGHFTSSLINGTSQAIWGVPSDNSGLRLVAALPNWQSFLWPSSLVPAIGLSSAMLAINGSPVYVGTDSLIYAPNSSSTSLQAAFGGPAVGDSGITGFYDGTNYHIFYVGSDGHLHEYYSPNMSTWSTNDLCNAVHESSLVF